MTFKRIIDETADSQAHFDLLNRYSEDSPFTGLGFEHGQFWRIRQEQYWYFLELMPPLGQTSHSFAMSEFTRGNLTASYHRVGKRFYCATIAYEGAESVREAYAAIANATAADN